MNKNYTFSCQTKRNMPKLQRRPWWNLFGKDKIVHELQWVRVVLNNLNEHQAKVLQESDFVWGTAWTTLFLLAFGDDVRNIQLEENTHSSGYIKNEYVKTQPIGERT